MGSAAALVTPTGYQTVDADPSSRVRRAPPAALGSRAGALRLSREVALDRGPRKLWLAEHPVEDLDGSTQGNPIIVRGKQESQTDDRPIEKLGLGEILKLLDLELFAKILAPAEPLSACVAPLRAILASELMGFGAVLEQGGRGGLIALRRAVREPTLVWPMLWEIASCA